MSMQKSKLFLLTLSHFCVDTYATLLAPLLPFMMVTFGLNLASAGFLVTFYSVTSLSQPFMGVWGDRMQRRRLVIGGLILASVLPLMGVAGSYPILLVILFVGGLGVAAFHPQVFSLAGELSQPRRSFGISLFVFGGTLGIGLTPWWVPFFADRLGLHWLPVFMPLGVIFALLLKRLVPLDNPQASAQMQSLRQVLHGRVRPLVLVTTVAFLRTVAAMGVAIFLPILAAERGYGSAHVGIPLGVFNLAGVCGSLLAGYLADRYHAKPLVWSTILLSGPILIAALYTEGLTHYALLALGGGLVLCSNPLTISMAQEIAPRNSGLASSLTLGLSWSLASLTFGPIGYVADLVGIVPTLAGVACLTLPAGLLALFLPSTHKQLQSETEVSRA
jgi:FSR family fosmidomycin resistance protein-like MFS transporter